MSMCSSWVLFFRLGTVWCLLLSPNLVLEISTTISNLYAKFRRFFPPGNAMNLRKFFHRIFFSWKKKSWKILSWWENYPGIFQKWFHQKMDSPGISSFGIFHSWDSFLSLNFPLRESYFTEFTCFPSDSWNDVGYWGPMNEFWAIHVTHTTSVGIFFVLSATFTAFVA